MNNHTYIKLAYALKQASKKSLTEVFSAVCFAYVKVRKCKFSHSRKGNFGPVCEKDRYISQRCARNHGFQMGGLTQQGHEVWINNQGQWQLGSWRQLLQKLGDV